MMSECGYLALFVVCFLSATLLPFSSEAVLSAMIIADYDPILTVSVATAGNWLGSMFTYAMGYLGNLEKTK